MSIDGVYETPQEERNKNSTTDVCYIGGLPRGWKQEQLLGWLGEQGVQVDLSSFSSRRAYAIVSLQTKLAPKLLALDAVKIEQTQLPCGPAAFWLVKRP